MIDMGSFVIVSPWLEGKSLSSIARTKGYSKQRVQVLFNKEIATIEKWEGFDAWFSKKVHRDTDPFNGSCPYFLYYAFECRYGKLLAYLMKKREGYTLLNERYATKEKFTAAGIKKCCIACVRERGNFYLLQGGYEKLHHSYGFNDIVSFLLTDISAHSTGNKRVPICKSFTKYMYEKDKVCFVEVRGVKSREPWVKVMG